MKKAIKEKNIDGDKYQNIFQNGVNYFRNK